MDFVTFSMIRGDIVEKDDDGEDVDDNNDNDYDR